MKELALSLTLVEKRYLYKLGGTTEIGKLEILDLSKINFNEKIIKKGITFKNITGYESGLDLWRFNNDED
jgi:hypothetical protein